MIKLSDYLNYLSDEIIQARKNMDLKSIENAKFYSEHEYLKYFKAPRFTMPTVKLEIPIKITDIDAETKYNFKMDRGLFLNHVNKNLTGIEKKHDIVLKKFTNIDLDKRDFKAIVKKIEKHDQHFTSINTPLYFINIDDISKIIPKIGRQEVKIEAQDAKKDARINNDVQEAIADAFNVLHKPSAIKLNQIYISPNTGRSKSGEEDVEKILVNLNVELVEENLKITKIKDSDGKEFEEIMLDQ